MDLGVEAGAPDLLGVAPPLTCSDGRTDGDESDVDCGGSCLPCAEGRACVGDRDCQGFTCRGSVCRPAETCPAGFGFALAAVGAPGGRPGSGALPRDLDGDGLPELVLPGLVWRNRGRGVFDGAPVRSELGAGVPEGFDLADLDGDGAPDLVAELDVGGEGGWLMTARNLGGDRLHFAARALLSAGPGYRLEAVADLDGDKLPDVVADYLDPGTREVAIRIFRGRGAGLFADPVSYPGGGWASLSLADLDGDGAPDLLGPGDGTISVWRNQHGAFPERVDHAWPLPRGGQVLVGDVDGDGALDLVRLHAANGLAQAAVLRQRGGVPGVSTVVPLPSGVEALAVSDLDLDGRADLVYSRTQLLADVYPGEPYSSWTLGVLLAAGDAFRPLDEIEFGKGGGFVDGTRVHVGDLDGDRRPDALCFARAALEAIALERCR